MIGESDHRATRPRRDLRNIQGAPPIAKVTADFVCHLGRVRSATVTIASGAVISGFGEGAFVGQVVRFIITASPDIKHNSSAIICLGGDYVQCEAGDNGEAIYEGGGIWRMLSYNEAARRPAYRNYGCNTSFDSWLRGTSFAGGTKVNVADYWCVRTNANDTISRQAGFDGAQYCMRIARNNGDTNTTAKRICLYIPTQIAMQLAGKKLQVSESLRIGANYSGGNFGCTIYTSTGVNETFTPGTPAFTSSTTSTSLANVDPTTTPIQGGTYRYNHSWNTVPSDCTEMVILWNWSSSGTAGAADYIEMTKVKVEVGTALSAYEPDPESKTMADALRQFWKTFAPGTTPASNVGAGTGEIRRRAQVGGAASNSFGDIRFPLPMFKVPTITTYNPAAAGAEARDLTAAATCSATASANVTENGCEITTTGAAGTTAHTNNLGVHVAAEGSLFN